MELFSHEYFMQEALKEANYALQKNEIPVGAIIVAQQKIIARTHNLTQLLNDVTAHAEMQAITTAANAINGKYLKDCTMYVTLEPCAMCAGALGWSQISTLVYGASDSKKGYSFFDNKLLHPKTTVISGILADKSSSLLQIFFQKLRK